MAREKRRVKKLTLDEAVYKWFLVMDHRISSEGNFSIKTRDTYKQRIKLFVSWIKTQDFDFLEMEVEDAEDYKYHLIDEKKYQMITAKSIFNVAKYFYEFLLNQRWTGLSFNVFSRIKFNIKKSILEKKADEKALTWEQVNKILSLDIPFHHKAVIATIAGTGLRISEIENLRYNDVSYNFKEAVFVLKVNSAKSGKIRKTFFLDSNLNKIFNKWINQHDRLRRDLNPYSIYKWYNPDLVFNIPPNAVKRYLIDFVSKKVGFRVTCHGLRYAFGGRYMENGGKLERLCNLMGHSSHSMTQWYTRTQKMNLSDEDFEPLNYRPIEHKISSKTSSKVRKIY